MSSRDRGASVLAAALAVTGASSRWGGQAPASAPARQPSGPVEVAVPEGDGAPVITDGLFSPAEWDDARRIEFVIRRSKLPGPRWLVRVWASVLAGGRPGSLVHPAGTAERTTEGWQVLRLD